VSLGGSRTGSVHSGGGLPPVHSRLTHRGKGRLDKTAHPKKRHRPHRCWSRKAVMGFAKDFSLAPSLCTLEELDALVDLLLRSRTSNSSRPVARPFPASGGMSREGGAPVGEATIHAEAVPLRRTFLAPHLGDLTREESGESGRRSFFGDAMQVGDADVVGEDGGGGDVSVTELGESGLTFHEFETLLLHVALRAAHTRNATATESGRIGGAAEHPYDAVVTLLQHMNSSGGLQRCASVDGGMGDTIPPFWIGVETRHKKGGEMCMEALVKELRTR
jgi:hypothetical protein